jgi:hypothetical protein
VGTSISNRSPATARWEAVQRAYQHGLPQDRVVQELLNAAVDWRAPLSSKAISEYVSALRSAYDTLSAELTSADRPEVAIHRIVSDATEAALQSSTNASAAAIAERALQQVLISTARRERPLFETTSREAAAAWRAQRGETSTDLVARFFGAVFGQFARHAVNRDIAALVGHERFPTARAARQYADEIAEHLEAVATERYRSSPRSISWRSAVRQMFAIDRETDA